METIEFDIGAEVSANLKDLDRQLSNLQRNFTGLKNAILQAMAPLGNLLVPVVNQAVLALSRLFRAIGQVTAAVLGAVYGYKSLGQGAEAATDGQKKLAAATTAAGKAAKRTLASFDRINRLDAPGGGGGSSQTVTLPDATKVQTLSASLQGIVDKLLLLMAPLRAIDLTYLITAFENFKGALNPLLETLGQTLQWLYEQAIAPLVSWIVTYLAPALVDVLTAALELVNNILAPVREGFALLLEAVKPVAEYFGEVVIAVLQGLENALLTVSETFKLESPQIVSAFSQVAQAITRVYNIVAPALSSLLTTGRQTLGGLAEAAGQAAGWLINALGGISTFLEGTFAGDWELAWTGIKEFMAGVMNSVIGLVNSMLRAIVQGFNGVITAANKVRFTVPDWVPGIGGKSYGFNMKTMSVPQIPQLAKGAVLPANKPFLAMVGDQKHGTNVEAPLATIQEAVALVMSDTVASQQAAVTVLKQILAAVLGLDISDRVLAEAVDRHNRDLSVIHGGVY